MGKLLLKLDFHNIFYTMEVNGDQQLLGYHHSSKYLLLKKETQETQETHTGLEQLEGEKMMRRFRFLGELSL